MEFQKNPGTYAAVDPFKPSISFSVKKILGSQKARRDDTDLNSPPPRRAAISTRRQGAIRPPTNTTVGPRFEAPPDAWIPAASSYGIRLPSPYEHRPGIFGPPIPPLPASDAPIASLPHDFMSVHRSDWSNRPPAARMDAPSTNSRWRNTSPYENPDFQARRRSRSLSSSDRRRERRRSRSPPLILQNPPRVSSSQANEQPRRKRNFRSRPDSRPPSPSAERNEERFSSPRRQRSRLRSWSPVRPSRSSSRSTSPSTRSNAEAPMAFYYSPAPRTVATEHLPPTIILPPPGIPELRPLPSSLPSPIIIQPSSLRSSSDSPRSRSVRACSRTPPSIIPPHSPMLISIEPTQPPPTKSSDVAYGLLLSPTRNSSPQLPPPKPDYPTSYPSVPCIHSVETDARRPIVVQPPPLEFHCSAPHGYPLFERIDADASVSSRRSAVSLPSDKKQPVGHWDSSESVHVMTYVAAFVLDTLPRQLYLYFLLRLPYMYFSRVTRIFEEAEMSMPQIKQGILEAAIQLKEPVKDVGDAWKLEPVESVQYSKLQNTWQSFIDSLMREWKTLNIISVLLLSAILTILQIQSAANDPLTRYSALLSMICALMSLFYGCIYIIRFGTMRKTYKAAEWAQEAQTSRTGIFWNVWVLLAMPATWFAWSMIMFIVCIMSLVWRTGTTDDADRGPMTPKDAFAFRIIVTVVQSLGLIYFVLIASTLRRYGEMMDQAWHRRIVGWINDTVAPALYSATSRHALHSASGSGHIPTAPVPPTTFTVPSKYYPTAESGFGPTLNPYSTDRPYRESKSSTIRSKSASSRSHAPLSGSKAPLRPPTPHAGFTFSNLIRGHDYGTDDKHDVFGQPASTEENLSRDLMIPSNVSSPPPPFSPVFVPTPVHPSQLSEAVPDEVYHNRVIDLNLSQEPIKLARLLLLSFEGDYPLDVPPSEEELKACNMTKELWKELQTDAQRFWYPLHPENIARTLHEWNTKIFFGHGAQIALCETFTDAELSRFALYFFSSARALPPAEGNNYFPLPEGLRRLDIFDFSPAPINTTADIPILVTEDISADGHGGRKISLISSNLEISARQSLSADLDNGIPYANSDSRSFTSGFAALDPWQGPPLLEAER